MPYECHDLYLSMSSREFMVQKDDECIFTLAFYHDEELPTELMSVTRVNTEV